MYNNKKKPCHDLLARVNAYNLPRGNFVRLVIYFYVDYSMIWFVLGIFFIIIMSELNYKIPGFIMSVRCRFFFRVIIYYLISAYESLALYWNTDSQ